MNGIVVFAVEVAVSLALSALILARLQALLRRVGNEVCERGNRGATEFWVAYTQLMIMIAPVLLLSMFSQAGAHGEMLAQVKSSLALVLTGQFAGLLLVGRAVWNSIVRGESSAPTASSAPLAAA
jgi:isoprenylcysteine carboxyl methyltransferase (ICMT) family protein YpbQ